VTAAAAQAEAALADQRAELATVQAQVVSKQQSVLVARRAKAHSLARAVLSTKQFSR